MANLRKSGALGASVLLICASAATLTNAETWKGARIIRIDHSARPAFQKNIQVPILSYQAAEPQLDSDGRIWLPELAGRIRAVTPFLGITGEWQIPSGTEAHGIETPSGDKLVVSRDGGLYRLNPDSSGDITLTAEGLPTAFGFPCRSGLAYLWPDIRGGVSITNEDGTVDIRYEDEIFKKRRIRGGAAVGCEGNQAFAAVAGGKIVGLTIEQKILWAESPGVLAGATFGGKVVHIDSGWIACSRKKMCFKIDTATGLIAATTEFGSFDGPHQNKTHIIVPGSDGSVYQLDQDLNVVKKLFIENAPLWGFNAQPAGNVENAISWISTSTGHIYRVDFEDNSSERVYTVQSGLSSGGLLLHDGTALLISNLGSTHQFEFK